MISDNDVKKLASLARLNISPEEEKTLAEDMENILKYVQQIQAVSSTSVASQEYTKNVFREDTNPHESGIHTEALLEAAPEREGEYIKVKKIL